ncbi:hypothetical protein PUR61_02060 [Streptomyces sp. BE20]|uniref:hypothetical protein n=1 Tax=Streptomyces sp. BE20 TaxID=3002525 RepID=UPI002E7A57AB|nr:hypothetical protein [Streptomyces sp. BE20]MEE1820991.1 hypothetical protein [Streptomyces sp. BE20]
MSAAAGVGRPAVPADAGSLALARLLAGPSGVEEIAQALDWSLARMRTGMAHLQQVTGARDRTELVADYAWAGHLTARHLGAHDLEAFHGLPAEKRLLRLTAGGADDRVAGAEIGAGAATVRQRRDVLLGILGVVSAHQAVGLGCLAGVVRRADMPGRFGPAPVPVAEHLRLPVALALRRLTSSGRALVTVTRSEQPHLAAVVAARAGGLRRVLVLTEPGEYWQHDLEVLAAAHRETGQVLAVLGKGEAARLPPLPAGVAAAASPLSVRATAGSTLPAVLVTTPAGLRVLDRLQQEGHWPPLDLAIAFDAHLPGVDGLIGRPEGCPPVGGVLRLTSTPRFTSADRAGRGGCERAVTGELTAAVPLRQAAELGLVRGYRLAATVSGRSSRHAAPAQLVADLVRGDGLRRVLVHSGPCDVRLLALAFARVGLAAEVLPTRDREPVLTRWFADDRAPMVLVTDRTLPPGLGADALVHTAAGAPTGRTAAVVEAALTPGRPGEGPLLVVSADRADEDWSALAELTGALSALDPHLAKDLAGARDRHTGHAGLEFALPLPAGAGEQRARAVCAWADTTWDEEMHAAARALAAAWPRRGLLSPSGRPLSTWPPARSAARIPAPRLDTGGAA